MDAELIEHSPKMMKILALLCIDQTPLFSNKRKPDILEHLQIDINKIT